MSTVTSQRPRQILTDNEKRKKLAKLSRTLGENVPPELVFDSPPPLQRTTSIPVSRLRKSPSSHKSSRTQSTSSPFPIVETTSTPPLAKKPENSLKQQRSLTIATQSARGTTPISVPAHHNTIDPPSQETTITVDAEATKQHDAPSLEGGRRKGREWSGEWNVKDMEHVAKALRGLKAS